MTSLLDLRPDPFLQRITDWFDGLDRLRREDVPRGEQLIRVEEHLDDDRLMIRAEIPGIDPERDVEIHVSDGVLTISATREEKREERDDGRYFSEFRYGTFRRTLRVPRDTDPDDISAAYRDGILTITVPMPEPEAPPSTKVPINRE